VSAMLKAGAPCPYGVCDGTGFVDDEASRTVTACRCRPQRIAQRRTASLSAVIPRKYRGAGFDRPPVPEIAERCGPQVRAVRAFAADIDAHLEDILAARPKAVWFQSGIRNDRAAERLARAGIKVVQDRCLMVEHRNCRGRF